MLFQVKFEKKGAVAAPRAWVYGEVEAAGIEQVQQVAEEFLKKEFGGAVFAAGYVPVGYWNVASGYEVFPGKEG